MTGVDPVDTLGDQGAALKALVTEAINEHLRPLRVRRTDLARDPNHLNDVLRAGNTHANQVAETTLNQVREAMTMTY